MWRGSVLASTFAVAALGAAPASAGTSNLYENDFSSKSLYREIRQVGGGDACKSRYLPGEDVMRVKVTGEAHCVYRPPVMQSGDLPEQRWIVRGQISDEMARGKRIRAYLSARVRAGLGGFYQLRIHPQAHSWVHHRKGPGEEVELLDGGRLESVHGVGFWNRMFVRAIGDTFDAKVHGGSTDFPLQDPDPVPGRGVRFGIGSTLDRQDPVIGYFSLLRAIQPD